jgi:hypothetical protein
VGRGLKPDGFRSKHISKKPIIPLKPFWKSSGQSVKLCFRSSLRLLPKPEASHRSSSLPETTPEWSSALFMARPPPGGVEVDALVASEGAGPAPSISFGCPLWPKPSPSSVSRTALFLSSSGGGSSSL